MVVNIITLAVVIGFQNEVSDKVLGFGSHAIINSTNSNSVFENEAILKNQPFINQLKTLTHVKNVQAVAYKPAILQSDKNNLKTLEKQQEIQSVLVKGVDESYDFSFFESNLVEGRITKFNKNNISDEIILSKRIAQDLNFKLGDEISAFFVKNNPVKKRFKLVGIYETGMEDLDKKIILSDIRQIQQLNDWGIKSEIDVLDTLANDYLIIKGLVSGGNGNFRYNWGKGFENYSGFTFYPTNDTIFRLIASDYWMFIDGKGENTTIPDTSYLKVKIIKDDKSGINSSFKKNKDGTIKKEYLDDNGNKFRLQTANKTIEFEKIEGKGSYQNYIGAFEINFHSWENFDNNIEDIKKRINFMYSDENQDLKVSSLKENQQEIFVWLSFLDINVWIIISLMLLIGIINMGSALLVMILLKTSFIGIMKGLGANSWQIRKIFLIQVSFLIVKGMFWGNIIGIGLCFLQDYFQLIKLNPEVYYLNAVPIELNFSSILFINAITLIFCLLAMFIPSFVITRISPAKSIKFN
jgi:lipoprotein-releasing system permease protein